MYEVNGKIVEIFVNGEEVDCIFTKGEQTFDVMVADEYLTYDNQLFKIEDEYEVSIVYNPVDEDYNFDS